ncbi:hypothetical protein HN954_03075 [bacterium]|nr:hypothetical protein [bacterium]MBT6832167.1 hypothetical protein [bacterium]MBT6996387.1 hypothetical protein [bacterium]MBT7772122.1 hypothetical protein [bacterium]
MEKPKVGIIGKGQLGTALKKAFESLLGKTISELSIWEKPEDEPENSPDILFLAIPSDAMNGARLAILDYITSFPFAQVIITSKGERALQIFCEKISEENLKRCFSMSGPNIADQIGTTPTATVLAGKDFHAAEVLATQLSSQILKIVASGSTEVVQRGGMLKNFFVFELGKIWDVLVTPMAKLEATISALRAGFQSIDRESPNDENRAEIFGISGLGDLLLCLDIFPESAGSRNFRAGKMKAQNCSDSEILQKFRTLEGLSLSNSFSSDSPLEFLTGTAMEDFRDLTVSPEKVSPAPAQNLEMLAEADALWERFLSVSISKKFLPNTHAWVACEIFSILAEKFSIDLSDFSKSEILLRSVLQSIFVPGIEDGLAAKQLEKNWEILQNRLPFEL